jgi:hypothetical protein
MIYYRQGEKYMTITKEGKNYKVDSVTYEGMCIQVNGTTITDCEIQSRVLGMPKASGYAVFCDSDEISFDTFLAAYVFATKCQKNTHRIA